MPRKRVAFIDSTLRDGQETLLGGRLRLDLVEPVLDSLDEVGFHSIDAWGGGTFLASLSRLHEDPWERLSRLKKSLKRTPLQMLIRGRCLVGDRPFSYSFIRRFLKRTSELGVDIIRLFDPVNDLQSLSRVARLAGHEKLTVQASILCSERKYSANNYRKKLRGADSTVFDSIGLLDPIGTLSVAHASELTLLLREATGLQTFAHIHSLEGSGILPVREAWKNGATLIDTCFSAFADRGSLPSVEVLSRDLGVKGFDGDLDRNAMLEVSDFFRELRGNYFDRAPSIMRPVSALEEALSEKNPFSTSFMTPRVGARRWRGRDGIRRETWRIVDELGLVTLASPVSEVVARQAILNLQSVGRYYLVTEDFLRLIRGEFGKVTVPPALLRLATKTDDREFRRVGIDERIVMPLNESDMNACDLLSFGIFPREWDEMITVTRSLRGRERMIVAAVMAIVEEEKLRREPSEQEALAVEPSLKPSRWRSHLGLEEEGTPRGRGFLQEPL